MKRLVIALALVPALVSALVLGACSQPASIGSSTSKAPGGAPDPQNTLILTLKTGAVSIKLLPNLAPNHVARVKKLAAEGFYNGLVFHRVIAGFMAQSGDPTGTGRGGSKYGNLPAEFSKYAYKRGTVGAARSASPNSANSQFFICYGSGCSGLTGKYTVWGQVVAGMEHVDKIKLGEPPVKPDKIVKMQLAAAGKI